jgi:hypothetical protein
MPATTYRIYSRISREILVIIWQIFFSIRLICGSLTMLTKLVYIVFFQHKNIKPSLLRHNFFMSFFGKYFFNSTYTRVDLYASIYGKLALNFH